MEAGSCFVKKLVTVVPGFERTEGSTHHDSEHIRMDWCDGVRTPQVHGEEVAGSQKLGRSVEKTAKE